MRPRQDADARGDAPEYPVAGVRAAGPGWHRPDSSRCEAWRAAVRAAPRSRYASYARGSAESAHAIQTPQPPPCEAPWSEPHRLDSSRREIGPGPGYVAARTARARDSRAPSAIGNGYKPRR